MLEVSTDGKRVNWIKIKVLNVDKGAENTIKYKYNYDHENQCEKKTGDEENVIMFSG